ncbi:hypothetical protein [Chryseobacterium sp. KMC2]|uniref:hypothetical protein n=1 Tax=Chryseobacterium sp. KMC2 TaxID=2800705 RepID=UPI001920F481|nr:hypothetical protein [Chryseobacterium sp. KMC2]MBL3546276.1 hypothetical protein [Chryseobacterium sp. KMC2]
MKSKINSLKNKIVPRLCLIIFFINFVQTYYPDNDFRNIQFDSNIYCKNKQNLPEMEDFVMLSIL